ncbi:MAG TPA: DUF6624 domain-containing protein [Gemmatimonadaceae bacterium]|nr:DUF6624 domain-containing protein [Gemmatimonadaceae bacterium]
MHRSYALVLAFAVPATLHAQAGTMRVPQRDEALRAALISRGRQDQAVREVFLAGHHQDTTDLRLMSDVDADNTSFLKKIVAERGWPGRSLVGGDAESAAFLIVQHSPDSAFQARVLPLLEKAYAAGEAEGQQVALLTDRVAVQRGQPQVYGTQASIVNGRFRLNPIADSVNVDRRRAALKMPPVAAYMRILDSLYSTRIP